MNQRGVDDGTDGALKPPLYVCSILHVAMFRLTLAGPDTHVASSLCAACPHAAAGCCVAPPRYAWADIARVVMHGGRDWLLEQIREGRLTPFEHGLVTRRVKGRASNERGAPRIAKCVFHEGGVGCTIPATHRPATCNYYVCRDVFEDARRDGEGRTARAAEDAHDALVERFIAWDEALGRYVGETYPEGPCFDAAFLSALGEAFARLQASDQSRTRIDSITMTGSEG